MLLQLGPRAGSAYACDGKNIINNLQGSNYVGR